MRVAHLRKETENKKSGRSKRNDRKALADLKASNIRDKERVWLLYTILKDADALDRVRFGMRAVDPKYFRNEITHKLLPTAQSCVGQLKL